MAYPIQCNAGFPMPLVAGKYEIVGFTAEVETATLDSQIAFFDDRTIKNEDSFGKLISVADIYTTKTLLIDLKNTGVAGGEGNLTYEFSEPIKVRNGISIAAQNVKGGSICLYRR